MPGTCRPVAAATVALALTASLLAAPSVAADNADPILRWAPLHAREAISEVRDRTGSLREAVTRGGFGAAVTALTATRAPSVPSPMVRRDAAGLPEDLVNAIAGLDSAVRTAIELIGELPGDAVRTYARAVRHEVAGMMRRPPTAHGTPDVATAKAPATILEAARHAPAAAAMVAAALDHYLPALRRWAGWSAGSTDQECDVLDQTPYLCVSSAADTVATTNAALLIDLGGNDTYRNSAGGAPILRPEADAYIPVSVNLDLSGHDQYEHHPTAPAESGAVQGAGAFGAVGILVDMAGNDRYEAAAPAAEEAFILPGAVAQGVGFGGIGLLFDMDGDDSYVTRAPSGPNASILVGQGVGYFCAVDTVQDPPRLPPGGCPVGALVDRGEGDDRYEMLAAAVEQPGGTGLYGQGSGAAGVGALVDDGGADVFIASASSLTSDPTQPILPTLQAFVQGVGQLGIGLLLTGSGPTSYRVDLTSEGRSFNRSWSQAVAVSEGALGVIDDLGGSDVYTTHVSLIDRREIVVEDDCACESATANVRAFPIQGGQIFDAEVFGHGTGYFAGTGILEDHSGDDTYLLEGEHRLDVTLTDELTTPQDPPTLDVIAYGNPWIRGQGLSRATAVGILADHGGTDDYTLRSTNRTTASAASANSEGVPRVEAASVYRFGSAGQGTADIGYTGVGALIDLGGTGDRIVGREDSSVTTSPDPDGAYVIGYSWPRLQASVSGGRLVALGDDPVILASPSPPTCLLSPAPHGFGAWLGCPAYDMEDPEHEPVDGADTDAVGLAPNAVANAPTLDLIEAPTAGAEGSRAPVGARLLDAEGKAVQGVALRFSLQWQAPGTGGVQLPGWSNVWEVEATTDAEGIARARLPLDLTRYPFSPSRFRTGTTFRVLVTYDGSDDLYPRHTAQPIQIMQGS